MQKDPDEFTEVQLNVMYSWDKRSDGLVCHSKHAYTKIISYFINLELSTMSRIVIGSCNDDVTNLNFIKDEDKLPYSFVA